MKKSGWVETARPSWVQGMQYVRETCEQAPTSRHRTNGAGEPEIVTQASGSNST